MNAMTWIVVSVIVFIALVIVVDGVRQRRIRAARTIDLRGPVAARLAEPGPAVLTSALASALTRESPVHVDLYVNLTEALEVANLRPRVQDRAEVKIFRLRWGNDYAMLSRADRELHYRLEVWEAELLPKMDGTRTVGELVVERMEAGGGLDAEPVTDLVLALQAGGFLDPAPIPTDELIADRLDPSSPGRKKLKRFGKTLSIDWKGADRFVRFCYRNLLRPFFWWPVALVSGLVAIAGLLAFFEVHASGQFAKVFDEESAPAEAGILLALAFFLTFMHELGHAVVISRYDRKVKSAGFMIYFGAPAFFVEATDSLMLDRRQRIVQSSAGPFTELIIAGVASLAVFAFPTSPVAGLLYKFAWLNYLVIFLNLIPLLELDGYWILSDAIQVPDLRPRSLRFIQHDLWHKLRVRERLTPQEWGLGWYGIAGVVFTIFSFWTGYIFWKEIFGELIVSLWKGNLGSKILLVLLGVFLAGPILRGLLNLGRILFRRLRGLINSIRFRFETSWRVEAAELIDALAGVRRSARERALGPRGAPPPADHPTGRASVPAGRSTGRLLRRSAGNRADRRRRCGDGRYAGAPSYDARRVVRRDGPARIAPAPGDRPGGRRRGAVRGRQGDVRSAPGGRHAGAGLRAHDAGIGRAPGALGLPRTRLGAVERDPRARGVGHGGARRPSRDARGTR